MKRGENQAQKTSKLPVHRAAEPVSPARSAKTPGRIDEAALLGDLRIFVQSARQRIAAVADATPAHLCWQVERHLAKERLQGGRAAYGKQILVTVSRDLTADYGRGFRLTPRWTTLSFAGRAVWRYTDQP